MSCISEEQCNLSENSDDSLMTPKSSTASVSLITHLSNAMPKCTSENLSSNSKREVLTSPLGACNAMDELCRRMKKIDLDSSMIKDLNKNTVHNELNKENVPIGICKSEKLENGNISFGKSNESARCSLRSAEGSPDVALPVCLVPSSFQGNKGELIVVPVRRLSDRHVITKELQGGIRKIDNIMQESNNLSLNSPEKTANSEVLMSPVKQSGSKLVCIIQENLFNTEQEGTSFSDDKGVCEVDQFQDACNAAEMTYPSSVVLSAKGNNTVNASVTGTIKSGTPLSPIEEEMLQNAEEMYISILKNDVLNKSAFVSGTEKCNTLENMLPLQYCNASHKKEDSESKYSYVSHSQDRDLNYEMNSENAKNICCSSSCLSKTFTTEDHSCDRNGSLKSCEEIKETDSYTLHNHDNVVMSRDNLQTAVNMENMSSLPLNKTFSADSYDLDTLEAIYLAVSANKELIPESVEESLIKMMESVSEFESEETSSLIQVDDVDTANTRRLSLDDVNEIPGKSLLNSDQQEQATNCLNKEICQLPLLTEAMKEEKMTHNLSCETQEKRTALSTSFNDQQNMGGFISAIDQDIEYRELEMNCIGQISMALPLHAAFDTTMQVNSTDEVAKKFPLNTTVDSEKKHVNEAEELEVNCTERHAVESPQNTTYSSTREQSTEEEELEGKGAEETAAETLMNLTFEGITNQVVEVEELETNCSGDTVIEDALNTTFDATGGHVNEVGELGMNDAKETAVDTLQNRPFNSAGGQAIMVGKLEINEGGETVAQTPMNLTFEGITNQVVEVEELETNCSGDTVIEDALNTTFDATGGHVNEVGELGMNDAKETAVDTLQNRPFNSAGGQAIMVGKLEINEGGETVVQTPMNLTFEGITNQVVEVEELETNCSRDTVIEDALNTTFDATGGHVNEVGELGMNDAKETAVDTLQNRPFNSAGGQAIMVGKLEINEGGETVVQTPMNLTFEGITNQVVEVEELETNCSGDTVIEDALNTTFDATGGHVNEVGELGMNDAKETAVDTLQNRPFNSAGGQAIMVGKLEINEGEETVVQKPMNLRFEGITNQVVEVEELETNCSGDTVIEDALNTTFDATGGHVNEVGELGMNDAKETAVDTLQNRPFNSAGGQAIMVGKLEINEGEETVVQTPMNLRFEGITNQVVEVEELETNCSGDTVIEDALNTTFDATGGHVNEVGELGMNDAKETAVDTLQNRPFNSAGGQAIMVGKLEINEGGETVVQTPMNLTFEGITNQVVEVEELETNCSGDTVIEDALNTTFDATGGHVNEVGELGMNDAKETAVDTLQNRPFNSAGGQAIMVGKLEINEGEETVVQTPMNLTFEGITNQVVEVEELETNCSGDTVIENPVNTTFDGTRDHVCKVGELEVDYRKGTVDTPQDCTFNNTGDQAIEVDEWEVNCVKEIAVKTPMNITFDGVTNQNTEVEELETNSTGETVIEDPLNTNFDVTGGHVSNVGELRVNGAMETAIDTPRCHPFNEVGELEVNGMKEIAVECTLRASFDGSEEQVMEISESEVKIRDESAVKTPLKVVFESIKGHDAKNKIPSDHTLCYTRISNSEKYIADNLSSSKVEIVDHVISIVSDIEIGPSADLYKKDVQDVLSLEGIPEVHSTFADTGNNPISGELEKSQKEIGKNDTFVEGNLNSMFVCDFVDNTVQTLAGNRSLKEDIEDMTKISLHAADVTEVTRHSQMKENSVAEIVLHNISIGGNVNTICSASAVSDPTKVIWAPLDVEETENILGAEMTTLVKKPCINVGGVVTANNVDEKDVKFTADKNVENTLFNSKVSETTECSAINKVKENEGNIEISFDSQPTSVFSPVSDSITTEHFQPENNIVHNRTIKQGEQNTTKYKNSADALLGTSPRFGHGTHRLPEVNSPSKLNDKDKVKTQCAPVLFTTFTGSNLNNPPEISLPDLNATVLPSKQNQVCDAMQECADRKEVGVSTNFFPKFLDDYGRDAKVSPIVSDIKEAEHASADDFNFDVNNEAFKDPSSFDFLIQCGNSRPRRDLRKESLFIKFDPLVGSPRSCLPQSLSQIDEVVPASNFDAEERIGSGEVCREDKNQTLNASIKSPPGDLVGTIERFLRPTPPLLPSDSRNNSVVSKHDWDHPSSDEIDTLKLKVSSLQEILKGNEVEIAQYKEQFKFLEFDSCQTREELENLKKQFKEQTAEKEKYKFLVEEFDKTIVKILKEKENDKKIFEHTQQQLLQECQTSSEHLANTEKAFADLHKKYEMSKTVIQGLGENEEILLKKIQEYDLTVKNVHNQLEALKRHATAQLDSANQEISNVQRNYETECSKLKVIIKKSELRISSLEETLEQKTKENKELMSILDELIAKVGVSGSR